jgi:hypothetical protein
MPAQSIFNFQVKGHRNLAAPDFCRWPTNRGVSRMKDYTFSSLSDYEFEKIVRDLLQEELCITLENFAKGRDGGIDLRYSKDPHNTLIVQCKHFSGSNYSKLKSEIKKEIFKIEKLHPKRYIIATSLPMTPNRKKQIADLLGIYCKSPQDIYGKEDLNNLLGKFSHILKKNIKLWLTDTFILERIIRSKIFNESESELQSIKRRMNLYVENESLPRAIEILEKYGHCIISGVPGIGKTTLAEMLLIKYVELGYEAFRIWEDVSEAREVFHSKKRQVFYYDDFLGQTGLSEKLKKNEDKRLLRFISDVQQSTNSKFILTTREYILNQAKLTYEALENSNIDLSKCILDLSDYTRFIRANILYNHLYFSDLENDYLRSIISDKSYLKIIDHKNYSPRIIERMTLFLNRVEIKPHNYVYFFIANLDDPKRVWEFAYEHHLSIQAVNLLTVMLSLSKPVFYEDLKRAFNVFQRYHASKYHHSYTDNDIRKAFKELEGNFISSEKSGEEIVINFHNPSITDFLESKIRLNKELLIDLISTSEFPDQILHLFRLIGKNPNIAIVKALLEQFYTKFNAPTSRLIRQRNSYNNTYKWVHWSIAKEGRFLWAIDIWNISKESELLPIVSLIKKEIVDRIKNNRSSLEDLLSIATAIKNGKIPEESLKGELFSLIENKMLDNTDPHEDTLLINDFRAIATFLNEFPIKISGDKYKQIRDDFKGFSEYEFDAISDQRHDPDLMLQMIEDLETVAKDFEIDLSEKLEKLREDANKLFPPDYDVDDRNFYSGHHDSGHSEGEIDSMFQSLENKMTNHMAN